MDPFLCTHWLSRPLYAYTTTAINPSGFDGLKSPIQVGSMLTLAVTSRSVSLYPPGCLFQGGRSTRCLVHNPRHQPIWVRWIGICNPRRLYAYVGGDLQIHFSVPPLQGGRSTRCLVHNPCHQPIWVQWIGISTSALHLRWQLM